MWEWWSSINTQSSWKSRFELWPVSGWTIRFKTLSWEYLDIVEQTDGEGRFVINYEKIIEELSNKWLSWNYIIMEWSGWIDIDPDDNWDPDDDTDIAVNGITYWIIDLEVENQIVLNPILSLVTEKIQVEISQNPQMTDSEIKSRISELSSQLDIPDINWSWWAVDFFDLSQYRMTIFDSPAEQGLRDNGYLAHLHTWNWKINVVNEVFNNIIQQQGNSLSESNQQVEVSSNITTNIQVINDEENYNTQESQDTQESVKSNYEILIELLDSQWKNYCSIDESNLINLNENISQDLINKFNGILLDIYDILRDEENVDFWDDYWELYSELELLRWLWFNTDLKLLIDKLKEINEKVASKKDSRKKTRDKYRDEFESQNELLDKLDDYWFDRDLEINLWRILPSKVRFIDLEDLDEAIDKVNELDFDKPNPSDYSLSEVNFANIVSNYKSWKKYELDDSFEYLWYSVVLEIEFSNYDAYYNLMSSTNTTAAYPAYLELTFMNEWRGIKVNNSKHLNDMIEYYKKYSKKILLLRHLNKMVELQSDVDKYFKYDRLYDNLKDMENKIDDILEDLEWNNSSVWFLEYLEKKKLDMMDNVNLIVEWFFVNSVCDSNSWKYNQSYVDFLSLIQDQKVKELWLTNESEIRELTQNEVIKWTKDWMLRATKDHFMSYIETIEDLLNLDYEKVKDWLWRAWEFISDDPLWKISDKLIELYDFAENAKEILSWLWSYERAYWVSYLSTFVWLIAADPVWKFTRIAKIKSAINKISWTLFTIANKIKVDDWEFFFKKYPNWEKDVELWSYLLYKDWKNVNFPPKYNDVEKLELVASLWRSFKSLWLDEFNDLKIEVHFDIKFEDDRIHWATILKDWVYIVWLSWSNNINNSDIILSTLPHELTHVKINNDHWDLNLIIWKETKVDHDRLVVFEDFMADLIASKEVSGFYSRKVSEVSNINQAFLSWLSVNKLVEFYMLFSYFDKSKLSELEDLLTEIEIEKLRRIYELYEENSSNPFDKEFLEKLDLELIDFHNLY